MIMIAAREGASQLKSARGTSEAEQTAAVFGGPMQLCHLRPLQC